MTRLSVVLALALLGACGWLPNHALDYRNASSLEPMHVPDDLAFIGEEALYPVPDDVAGPVYESADEETIPPPPQLVEPVAADEEVEEPGEAVEDPTSTRVLLTRDGSGYPIIMMHTSFTWAWEHVGQALAGTELKVEDRDRDAGLFYVKTPKRYDIDGNEVQVKLSHTVNGIQVAVLNRKGTALLARESGQLIIQSLYDQL